VVLKERILIVGRVFEDYTAVHSKKSLETFAVKDHPTKAFANKVRVWAVVFALPMAIAIPMQGQSPQSQPENITNSERVRQQDMSKREWQLRNLGVEPPTNSNAKRANALMVQVEEDFKRILTLHNEMVRSLPSVKALDYDFLFEAAGEIKKRATRLQTTLVLPKPEGEGQKQEPLPEFNQTQIRDALILLCKRIEGFVNNPIIATPGTVNGQQLTKARRDLADVVELSGNVRKSADKLKKSSQ
jgi:hypothetical protein